MQLIWLLGIEGVEIATKRRQRVELLRFREEERFRGGENLENDREKKSKRKEKIV